MLMKQCCVSYIVPCCILCRQIEKQLFDIPVKNWLQMYERLRIKEWWRCDQNNNNKKLDSVGAFLSGKDTSCDHITMEKNHNQFDRNDLLKVTHYLPLTWYCFWQTWKRRILAERSNVMKPRSLRSLGPVKSSTFFLLKETQERETSYVIIYHQPVSFKTRPTVRVHFI